MVETGAVGDGQTGEAGGVDKRCVGKRYVGEMWRQVRGSTTTYSNVASFRGSSLRGYHIPGTVDSNEGKSTLLVESPVGVSWDLAWPAWVAI